ncbi:MAG: N-acetylmuramoyl-L-alanine amidase [Candidatus Marinimicrobia bacterium]|nr:N-acetylmuramoyl-L-alanine amidase [Candidatus Neomarinimicrobiota bacterium]
MKNKKTLYRNKFLYCLISFLLITRGFGALTIINPESSQLITKLEEVYFDNVAYFSIDDFAQLNKIRVYENQPLGKKVLYFSHKNLKITGGSPYLSFGKINKKMTHSAIIIDNQIYVPVHSFLTILKNEVYSQLRYSIEKEKYRKEVVLKKGTAEEQVASRETTPSRQIPPGYKVRLKSLSYEKKNNGVVIRIDVDGTCTSENLSGFFRRDEWFYLTVYKGICEPKDLLSEIPIESISRLEVINKGQSSILGFKLNHKFVDKDMYFDSKRGQIVISLFLPLSKDIVEKINKQWGVNTIVLDAGHGGKDPGTIGRGSKRVYEKDLVLDVVKRVGKILEKNDNINVVYTRKTDTFVPLWKRTEMANKVEGDLFISFHINACDSRRVNGTEIYLLRPGKAEDAIRVAKKENSVIKYESKSARERYKNYKQNILANMVHTANMKDSEKIAKILNDSYSSELSQKSRGVKQAGFIVLIGASMPKVLLELGYITNRQEAAKLNQNQYREKIARATAKSILEYKKQVEASL